MRTRLIPAAALSAAFFLAPSAFAQAAQQTPARSAGSEDSTPLTTDEKIERLQRELDDLKRQRDADQAASASTGATTAITTLDNKGLTIKSPDGSYVFGFNAQINVDADGFGKDGGTLQDQIQDRLIRPTFWGRAGNASFLITPELGGTSAAANSIVDAYIAYKVSDPLQFKFGKFKSPIGLERAQADADVLWTERGNSSNLVPNRDIGYQVFGTLASGAILYQLAELDGAYDGQSLNNPTDNRKDTAYRLLINPFALINSPWLRGLGIGYAGTQGEHLGNATNTDLPTYKTTGQQTFFKYNPGVYSNGLETRSNPQAYLYLSNFSLLADYVSEKQAVRLANAAGDVRVRGLDISGSWVLTGESTSFIGGVKPSHDFNINGSGWGAWELTARYGYTGIGSDAFTDGFASTATSASRETSAGYGVAWYLSQNLKLMADFDHTRFIGGATKGNRPDEDFTSGRVQFRY